MIDKESPNYQSYMKECRELGEWQDEEWKKILLRYPSCGRKNLLSERATVCLCKEFSRRLKILQYKYGYRDEMPTDEPIDWTKKEEELRQRNVIAQQLDSKRLEGALHDAEQ